MSTIFVGNLKENYRKEIFQETEYSLLVFMAEGFTRTRQILAAIVDFSNITLKFFYFEILLPFLFITRKRVDLFLNTAEERLKYYSLIILGL